MGTPNDFRLEMVDPNMCPLPTPPRYLKHQIYSHPSVFKAIDKHAVDEARTNYRNFRDLIWNLAYRKQFNQLERIRAIFRWMTTKNMFTVMFDSELPGSPEQVISGFKDGKTTYARIFECLATFSGIHCVTLSGWAKGVDYRPGSPICSTPINHSWNVCFIDGNWQLVDSHWATRYLQSERNTPENLVYEYDDFYFLPEPGHLIYSHCPEDPSWQLLKPAVPRSTFEEYPLVKSFFFTMGMEFLQQNYGVVYTKKGLVTLTLGFKIPNTAFTFKLGYGENMVETVHGIDLKRYVIQETTLNRVTLYFRAPKEGNYYLTAFAQQTGERLKLENVFKAACEYKIVCDQAAGDIRPYPQGSDANWGPGAPVQQYGLTPSHKTAILSATNGKAEVNFAKTRDVRLYARLNRDGMDEDMLERCVSVREQDNRIYLTAHLPAQGEYGLEIYANEPDIEGDTFTHMCQYLCSYIDRDFGTVYGQVFDRNDLAFKSQANPMMYASPQAQQFAAQSGDQSRMAPTGGQPGGKQVYPSNTQINYSSPQAQQYGGQPGDARYTPSDARYAPGDARYAPGDARYVPGDSNAPGDNQYAPGDARYAPGDARYAPGDARYAPGDARYAPGDARNAPGDSRYAPGDSRIAPAGGDSAAPGGKQVYQTSSQDWDGNTFTARSYREEQESHDDGLHSYSQKSTQMSTRMESVTIGGKKQPPPTAPKPKRGGAAPGGGDHEDLPPPPPELMQGAPENQRSPVEIVYVGAGDSLGAPGRGPGYMPGQGSSTLNKAQDDKQGTNKKPIEIVYVHGSPGSARKTTDGDQLPSLIAGDGMENKPQADDDLPPPPPSGGDKSSPSSTSSSATSTPTQARKTSKAGGVMEDARLQARMGSRAPSGDHKDDPLSQERYDREAPRFTTDGDTWQQGGPNYGQRPGEKSTTFISVSGQPGQKEQPGRRSPYGQQPQQYDQHGHPIPGQGLNDQPGRQSPYGQQPKQYDQHGRLIPGHGQDAPGQRMVYGQQPQYDQYGRPVKGQDQPEKSTSVPVYHTSYPFGGHEEQARLSDLDALRPVEPDREYTPHSQKTYTTSITVMPPASFEPKPITSNQEAPRPTPPSVPPKPFKDTSIFQNVDTHAVEVSKEEHTSFRDLVWHLIYARDITNELEKARAIFLWLCSKDLAELTFTDAMKGSPEEILMSLKKGNTTYAVVYETLCSYAGLHCKTISGYAKGAEYKPGMKFTGEQGQHSWNSVLVEGAWRLVDCHWAARRLVGKKVTAENVRYELDEYYFMPDPHQLIFTHFPDDRNWQLVERPISLSDFENLVPVKSAFFKYGLQILTHREAVITTNREITIRTGCPPARAHQLAFTFTLAYSDGREEYGSVKLNRFGMQEMVDNVTFFTIRPPEKASYRLIIYAKDLAQQSKEGVYGGVCEYELVCQSNPPNAQPFPPCVHTSWGPGDSATKYALQPRQKGAIFSTVRGMAEVRFSLPRDLRFTAKLKSNDQDEKALQGYIMHRVVEKVAIFTITAPNKGEYGLEIYANDPDADGNSLYHAYQYLLICTDMPGPAEPLPALPPGYLGPQPSFRKLGLTAGSHCDPFIQLDSGDLQVTFTMEQPLRMTSQLIYVSEGKSEDFTDYILQQGRENTVIFVIKLPKMGLYKFQIYGLPYSDTSESLPGVYNYLVNCHQTQASLVPFPKQYGQWKEGCFLHEPLDGQLSPNRQNKGSASTYQAIYWKLEVSKANSVAVVIGEDWTQLEKKGNVWESEVNMEKNWGQETKAAICANYGTVKASYSTLLEYSM